MLISFFKYSFTLYKTTFNMSASKKPSLIVSFMRSQIVAILATGVDFAVFVLLAEIFGIWHISSTLFGAICGGITGFLLGRYWAFVSTEAKSAVQALKYLAVMGASASLNMGGMALFVDGLDVQQTVSRVIVATIVGIGFNFPLHKYFVFK